MKKVLLIGAMLLASNLTSAACVTNSASLSATNEVTCTNQSGPGSAVFKLESKSSFTMYISGQMLGDCGSEPAYYWETIALTGNVLASTRVEMGTDISVVAGNTYQMRVETGDVTACPNYDLYFNLDTY